MRPGRRRRPAVRTAVVGLVAGLALLCGAVLDGGLSTPTRAEVREPAGAHPVVDRSAPRPTSGREDGQAWDAVSALARPALAGPAALPGPSVLAVVAGVALLALSAALGAGRRAPALRAARLRGPPLTA